MEEADSVQDLPACRGVAGLLPGGLPHVRLRGRCVRTGVSYTKLAEPYPRQLCSILAGAMCRDRGLLGNYVRKLDVSACARGLHARIGEAKNPGPRRSPLPRRGSLHDVHLIEPGTIALRARIWTVFQGWARDELGDGVLEWIVELPEVFVELLVAYGHAGYQAGLPLSDYRQLLAHVQRQMPRCRPWMKPAWETVGKWEIQEPVSHRPPLPEPLLKAMAALSLGWQWYRWTAVLVFSFYSACRVGEVLRARRSDVLTPEDLLLERHLIFLKVRDPKSRRRGARVQYCSVDEQWAVRFLSRVWGSLSAGESLYPGSAGAFRSRWDAVLAGIRVPRDLHLTPGSLRAGGAVHLHLSGAGITDILWRMRLQHQKTLSFYLQEVTAASILPQLSSSVRDRISLLRGALPLLLELSPALVAGPAARST